jgi:hypothetical protein
MQFFLCASFVGRGWMAMGTDSLSFEERDRVRAALKGQNFSLLCLRVNMCGRKS